MEGDVGGPPLYRPHLRIHAADIDHGDRRRAAADHS